MVATLIATPPGTNPDNQPEHTELWINDFRLDVDKTPKQWNKAGQSFRKVLTIPNAKLRPGENILTFQVYSGIGGRAETKTTLTCTRPPLKPRLWGLSVGINTYSKGEGDPGTRGELGNLVNAGGDAEAIQKDWQAQQKTLYKEGTELSKERTAVFLRLEDNAKQSEILAALEQLAKKVGPEDHCIIFLAGHGVFVEHKGTKEGRATTWRFCCAGYNAKRSEETSISSEVLYEKLAQIAGHKLVILDACHSGEAATNPVRSLVPGNQGPFIMAACDRNQSAYEDQKNLKHGLFTYALLQVVEGKYPPDNKIEELDAYELYQYTRQQMPELLEGVGAPKFAQVPILFAPKETERFKVVRVK